ncbi:MAG: arylsulfatase, partial [Saprospiraceae bacterium]
SNAFCFITDIVPTILEMASMEPVSNKLYTSITGNSILPHIQDVSIPIYKEDEGVGLEAANNAAYYQGDFKIVKNNIPLGDGIWYMYNLKTDPGETKDISKTNAAKFQTMLAAYDEYAKAVGVIEMEEGYAAAYEVGRKSVKAVLRDYAPYLIGMLVFVIGLTWWIVRWRRLRKVT